MHTEERKPLFNYFTKGEISIWCISVTLIVASFLLFDRENYLTLVASFIGVTSLIFNAKGNPYNGNKAEVKVNRLELKEIIFMMILIAVITLIFYHILAAFHTANLIPSTISVTTSFLAVYLTFRRSAYYAIGYAANDIVLIILWALATISDISYLSVAICFVVFLVNDIYGFINWSRMQKRQENDCIIAVNN